MMRNPLRNLGHIIFSAFFLLLGLLLRSFGLHDLEPKVKDDWNRNTSRYVFLILCLAVGLGQMLWIDFRFVPFGLLLGPPARLNDFLAWGLPALLAGIVGFLRAKPKEIWSYGLLMWLPRAIRIGLYWMTYHYGIFGLVVLFIASSCLAGMAAILASYAGFGLRKLASRIWPVPEGPPTILGDQ